MTHINSIAKQIAKKCGRLISYLIPPVTITFGRKVSTLLYTSYMYRMFKTFGRDSYIHRPFNWHDLHNVSIGNKVSIGSGTTLTSWKLTPNHNGGQIIIEDNVSIGEDAHITATTLIHIGKNVLTGKKVLITDNAHGASTAALLDIAPVKRPLYSKGGVYIEDNVWIGEKVSIMPGVRIGKGSIIAANSVVTKDIPPYCVAAGIPAKVIKQIK